MPDFGDLLDKVGSEIGSAIGGAFAGGSAADKYYEEVLSLADKRLGSVELSDEALAQIDQIIRNHYESGVPLNDSVLTVVALAERAASAQPDAPSGAAGDTPASKARVELIPGTNTVGVYDEYGDLVATAPAADDPDAVLRILRNSDTTPGEKIAQLVGLGVSSSVAQDIVGSGGTSTTTGGTGGGRSLTAAESLSQDLQNQLIQKQLADPNLTSFRDERTGETVFIDPTGREVGRLPLGFAGIDPERTFALDTIRGVDIPREQLRSAEQTALLNAGVRGFESVNQLAPQLGNLALASGEFTRDVLRNPADFLARAFFSRGGTSPLPVISQADVINQLRQNLQGFNDVLSGFQMPQPSFQQPQASATTNPMLFPPAAPATTPTAAPTAAPTLDLSNPHIAAWFGGAGSAVPAPSSSPAPTGYTPTASAVVAPTLSPTQQTYADAFAEQFAPSSSYATDLAQKQAAQQFEQYRAKALKAALAPSLGFTAGVPVGSFGEPPSVLGFADGTGFGFVNEPVFRVGEPVRGRPNEEIVVNPTGAPVAVIPKRLAGFQNGTAAGSFDGFDMPTIPRAPGFDIRGFADGTPATGLLAQLQQANQERFGTADTLSTAQDAARAAPTPAPAPAQSPTSAPTQQPLAGFEQYSKFNPETGNQWYDFTSSPQAQIDFHRALGTPDDQIAWLASQQAAFASPQAQQQAQQYTSSLGIGGTGFNFAAPQLPVPAAVTQQEILDLARQNSPPAVNSIIAGQQPPPLFQGGVSGGMPGGDEFALPTLRMLQGLTPDELDALRTRLAASNISLDDLIFAVQQRFLGPATRRARFVR